MTSRRWDRGRGARGNGPLSIQGTLGTLLRTTLHQMGVVKDAVERQARSSLGQLDAVMLQRRHREALARLGEVVRDLARSGELAELAEHTEIRPLLDEVAELEERAHESAGPEDGTVSAADGSPATPRRGAADGRGPGRQHRQDLRVWRPSIADVPDAPEAENDAEGEPAGAPEAQERGRAGGARPEAVSRSRGRRSRRNEQAGGGIAFMEDGPGDEDDDLARYMHDDDVPRRG